MNADSGTPASTPSAAIDATVDHAVNRHVYVLRLWREDEGSAWRMSLQSPENTHPQTFVELDQLMLHLLRLIEPASFHPTIMLSDVISISLPRADEETEP